MGSGEAKELKCMTHEYELSWGNDGGGVDRAKGKKGERKRDNCNSIINKIYI